MGKVTFKARLSKPEKGNKYYIRKADGGYSDAIVGKPTDPDCNVLSNCVGYSVGRFNEIGEWGECKYLAPVNAGIFMDFKGDCETGFEPKLGACMVWRKNGSTSAGHVASVEQIVDKDTIVCSESSYNGKAFYLRTRHRDNGNWEQGSSYTFKGFIYNPAVGEEVDWEKAYNSLSEKYGKAEEELNQAKKDLTNEKKKTETLENDLKTQNKALSNSYEELLTERKKSADLASVSETDKAEIARLNSKIKSLEQEVKDTEEINEKQIANLQREIVHAESEHHKVCDSYLAEINSLRKEIVDCEKIIDGQPLKGDINGDGKVNLADVFELLFEVLGRKGEK